MCCVELIKFDYQIICNIIFFWILSFRVKWMTKFYQRRLIMCEIIDVPRESVRIDANAWDLVYRSDMNAC